MFKQFAMEGKMRDEDEYLDPIRAAITALAYLLWKESDDLPPNIEEAIDDIMDMIE
jgi:hypothetical protein